MPTRMRRASQTTRLCSASFITFEVRLFYIRSFLLFGNYAVANIPLSILFDSPFSRVSNTVALPVCLNILSYGCEYILLLLQLYMVS